jgi:membrane-associated phospholipid phosphatase
MLTRGLQTTLGRYDRELGASLREQVSTRQRVHTTFGLAADVMSPAYRFVVLLLIVWRPTRAQGLRALIAAALAALIAKRIRDELARPRPGARSDGGLPSRHAAAAVAIATVLADHRPRLGLPMAMVTAFGLMGRISTGDHDPADVLAGALLGAVIGRVVLLVPGVRRPGDR